MPLKNKGRKPRNPKTKPYFPHASGYWAAKIAGKLTYLSRWETPVDQVEEAYKKKLALAKAEAEKNVDAARELRQDEITVRQLANEFLAAGERAIKRGEMAAITWNGYRICLAWAIKRIGSRTVSSLTPHDFTVTNSQLEKQYGSSQHGHVVAAMKMAFKWGVDNGFTERAPRYGTEFRPPGEVARRRERTKKPLKLFSAAQVRKMVDLADVRMKAMVLLGMNCAYLQSDCAELMIRFVDGTRNELVLGGTPYIRFDRPKTGVRRKCTLWPETVAALKAVIGERKEGRVFLTDRGMPLVHHHQVRDVHGNLKKATLCDATIEPFADLRRQAGCYQKGVGFSALRTTFETIAWQDEHLSVADQAAIHWVMGHKLSGPETPRMADRYLQDIPVEKLKAVTDRMREWFLLDQSK